MALLPILEFPDPRLRTQAVDVDPAELATPAFQALLDDMFETMYDAPGIGLAASQVDVHKRFMVIDVSEDRSRPMVFVNPRIVASEGGQVYQEGCLSVPGVSDTLKRHHRVRARALDRQGRPFEVEAEGLLAQCIQHEIDHLDGKLYIDRLSSLKRERLLKRMREEREAAAGKAVRA